LDKFVKKLENFDKIEENRLSTAEVREAAEHPYSFTKKYSVDDALNDSKHNILLMKEAELKQYPKPSKKGKRNRRRSFEEIK
jgi:hypothetical protein